MGQSPSQLAQSYPYEYGCDVRLKGSLLTEDDAVELYWILRFAQNDEKHARPCFTTWHPIGVHVVRLGYKNEQAHFCSTRLWHTSCAFFLDSKMVLQAVPLHSSYEKVPTFSISNILYRDRHPDGLTLNK